ncbi:MAG: nitrogen regulation protein NR(II), partial [Candidatus Zixiibacteriota bacterium]
SMKEIIGKTINVLRSGKHDKKTYQDLWETIKAGKSWTGNLQNRRKDGKLYWERLTITPIFSENNKIINYLFVSNDITVELKTQQKLIESDKLSAVGTLAAGVAHEFKNYLGGIIGNASYTLEELDEENALEIAKDTFLKIIDMSEKANEVAMSLLTYSKARPEEQKPEDLKKLILRSISLVEKEMKNLSIEIITYFDDISPINVSASKIQQLLLNLLINAKHAIKTHGVITIALYNHGDEVEIKVADTGSGIPEENIDMIFDPFFSTKGVWGKDELVGTGMGLSICRNIAREHSGDLTVESITGIGTTFILTLPAEGDNVSPLTEYSKITRELKVLFFTLNKSIISVYYEKACEVNAQLKMVDNYAHVPDHITNLADIVVCDSKFTGKLELFKMVELCNSKNMPYIMVNSGTSEYQLAEIFKNSIANFKELPSFEKIILLANSTKEKFINSDSVNV